MSLRIIARICCQRPGFKGADQLQAGMIAEAGIPAECTVEVGEGIAPGFASRLRAAGHRHRLEPADPGEAEIIGDQELAAP
jgi:hypothetical protein